MPWTTYDEGEFINLYWDSDPDVYYVRGHVDETAFRTALAAWHGDSFCGPEPLKLRHAYAFWSCEGSEHDRVLRECQKRRGAFTITAMDADSTKPEGGG